MSLLNNIKKADLKLIAQELGQTVPDDAKMVDIKSLIENSDIYKTDLDFVRGIIKSIVEDQKIKTVEQQSQLELERMKLARLEKELELLKLKSQSTGQNAERVAFTDSEHTSHSLENMIKSVKTLTIPVPQKPEALHLFFQSLEKAFSTKNVPVQWKSEVLINVLGDKVNNVLAYANEQEIADYEKLKALLLKEFQPTPRECLGNFKNAQRYPNESHVQFASRLSATFDYYCRLREVDDFKKLCDLIVSDKLYETLDFKTREHVGIREGQKWFQPNELGRECDLFYSSRGKSLNETNNTRVDNSEHKRLSFNKNHSKKMQFNPKESDRKHVNQNNKLERICFVCGGKGDAFHYARDCPKRFEKNENAQKNAASGLANKTSDDKTARNQLEYIELFIDGKKVKCLKDSGSELIILNKALFPDKQSDGSVQIKSCFGNVIKAERANFRFSLRQNIPGVELSVAVCSQLVEDAIFPPKCLKLLSGDDEQNILNCNSSSPGDSLPFFSAGVMEQEIDLSHIPDIEQRQRLLKLISEYKPNKVKDTELKMQIILTDEIPISQRPRRMSFDEQKIVENQIKEWLNDGIIKPSCSDYAAPIVLSKKKNGKTRLCVDFRRLNQKTVKDRFPLPLIEDVIDHLEQSKVFTTLDLKNGFFHVDIDEKCRKYTSFVTHEGQYEFLKVPFGLCNSPSVFQRYIYHVFRPLLQDKTVIIYMDDFIIPSSDIQEGLEKLKRVFQVASEYGLELNFDKCQFLKDEIEFLGYVIKDGTIKPSPNKTAAVQKFPQPKTIKHIQSFLGLTGYFRKFIPHYSKIAKPLSDLLRAGVKFEFGSEQLEAFQKLKDILSQSPVLHIFKRGAPLELHTDASSLGFGAVLLQQADNGNLYPIHYMSKKTTSQQEKCCSYELEVLAIIEALKKFRNYLLGSKFKIITDCAAFQRTLGKKELSPKLARWSLFLDEFDYEVVHRPGQRMKHVDALSRNVMMVTCSEGEVTAKISAAQNSDERLQLLKLLVEQGLKEEYVVKNGVLYKYDSGRELLVVPEALEFEIIRDVHNKGHFAISKTEDLLKRDFYIPNLRKRVEKVIANCIQCILCERKQGKNEGLLNPIPKENIPLSTYHVDFIGPLPSTNKKYNHILTVVDAFTKFVWLYPAKSTSTQDALQKLRQQQVIFGNPSRVITDRGTAFTSKEFEDYCVQEKIQHIKTTPGVPRGNGQVERIHRTLIPVLAKLSLEDPTKWYKYVADVQRILNSTTCRSTKHSPFELLTGVKMRNQEDLKIIEILEEEETNASMESREEIREEARKNILRMQEENRKSYNRKRKKAQLYSVNDLVAIQRTQFGSGLKLRPKFFGPYRVTATKGNDRYQVEKVGHHEGPNYTSTSADHMKPWTVPN